METVIQNNSAYDIMNAFGVTLKDIQSGSRKADISDMRKILSYELRNEGFKLREIAELFHSHHTSIITSIKQYSDRLLFDQDFKNKVMIVERLKVNTMKLLLTLNNDKLLVLNNSMQYVDTANILSQPQHARGVLSICQELRTELLQKAIRSRQKDKSFVLKLTYHKADALYSYLKDYEIFFPDEFGSFEANAILQFKNELHKQLL